MTSEACREHGEAIARLEERMSHVERDIASKLDTIESLVRATNGRLRKVETWRAWLTGGVVVTAGALSAAGTVWAILRP